MRPTHGSTVLLLCLAVGFLNLHMAGKAAAGRPGDPDDDSWSAADNIGLNGGSEGDWAASQVTSPVPPSAVASGGDDTVDTDDPTEPDGKAPADAGGRKTGGGMKDRSLKRDDLDDREYGVGDGDGESSRDSSYGREEDDFSSGDTDFSSDDTDFSSDDMDFSSDDMYFSSDDMDFSTDENDFSSDDIDFSTDENDFSSDEFSFDDSDFSYGKRRRRYSYDDIDDESDYDSGRGRRYRYDDIDFDDDDDDDGVSRWRRRGSRSGYTYDLDDINEDAEYDHRRGRGRSRSRSGRRGGRRFKDIDYDFKDTDYGDGVDEFGIGSERDFDLSGTDTDSDPDFDIGDDRQDDFDDGLQSRRRNGRRGNRGDTGQRRSGRREREPVAKVRVLSTEGQATRPVEGAGDSVEIDDASATSEEIPSGYFSQAQGNPGNPGGPTSGGSGRCKGFAPGSIDLPGFRLVISEATKWWKYEQNVCLKKEFLRPSEIEMDDFDTSMVVNTIRCSETSMNEYSCNVTQWNGTSASVYRLTYTCCRGYTRMRKDKGCPRQILGKSTAVSESFNDLLRRHGYSQKIIDLFSAVLTNDTKKQWTVFVPSKAALNATLRRLDFRESSEDPVPEWFVRTVLNHFVQPAILLRSLRSGQLLPTEAKSGAALLITRTRRGDVLANCQPIVKADQPFNKYSLVHFTSSLLSIQQSSLFQLMLKRLELEAKLPQVLAGKLLAPIKALLTGTKPLTVFMHLPSAEEISNNCYARNLRSAIVYGVECNASLLSGSRLQTVDAKVLRLIRTKNRILIGDNRVVNGSDQLATNGVLHSVNVTESLMGFANELTRSLKSSDLFKPVFTRPGRAEGSLALLIPPHNGSYSYANTSVRWANASELAAFGRRHLLDNATALTTLTESSGLARLPTLDGTQRDFVQLVIRQESAAIFGPDRLVRYRFVDCVRIVQTAKDCSGVSYLFLIEALPNFQSSPTALEFLRGRDASNYAVVQRIVEFALERNLQELSSQLNKADAALVILKDADMHLLSMGMLNRRREPTEDQMTKLATWFSRYFVATKTVCAVKSVSPAIMLVPVFQIERRPCRSVICAFKRRVQDQPKRVRMWPGNRVVVKEGFLLPGQVLPGPR